MKNRIVIIVAMLLLLSSCVDQIVLKDQGFEAEAVVIQGRLVKAATALVEVTVQRIGDFENSELPTPINSAKVKLLSQDGTTLDLIEDAQNRMYRAAIPPSFPLKVGDAYRIQVQLLNGNQYESASDTLRAVPKMKQVHFRTFQLTQLNNNVIETLPYLTLQVSTPLTAPDATEKARLRWTMNTTYQFIDNSPKLCYFTEVIRNEQVIIYDGALFDAAQLDTFSLTELQLDYRFAEGFYLTLIQESLSDGAYHYWEQAKQLSERTGNMFEPPAGKIITNMINVNNENDPVYGYFYATEQDTIRQLIRPAEVGNPAKLCPYLIPPLRPTICDNCLLQRTGVTLQKPAFWIE